MVTVAAVAAVAPNTLISAAAAALQTLFIITPLTLTFARPDLTRIARTPRDSLGLLCHY
ncbi:hypothetical protein So717_06040 [Roseobacter cerasinus]|uniref:Uncharacterized protein n=1 Tax=Roseobacter cerasinus TaxID=2602289 RepID=A0A640VP45_9RHOB|nr:hypothetical protein So717_06040 [Roseobacter cerasinus]